MRMPGIGPITASAIVATIGDAHRFRTNRNWQLGWACPLSINPAVVRNVLARSPSRVIAIFPSYWSWAVMAKRSPEKVCLWTENIMADKPFRLATKAMANKAARATWAMLTKKQNYRRPAF